MARSITEIYDEIIAEKQSMTQLQDLQPQVDSSQTLLTDLTTTSKVAIWRLLFWVVAVAHWTHEKLFDVHKQEIEDLRDRLITGTLQWYQAQCLVFQFGDSLIWSGTSYQYPTIDPLKKIVKRAAVIEASGQLRIKVAKLDAQNVPQPLTATEKTAFETYIGQIKFAGTNVAVISDNADDLKVYYDVHYDPQVLKADGESIEVPGTYPVQEIVTSFIQNLPFNGVLNITALTDAIQSIEGVLDPVFLSAEAKYGSLSYQPITKSYQANAGHLVVDPAFPLDQTLNFIAGV